MVAPLTTPAWRAISCLSEFASPFLVRITIGTMHLMLRPVPSGRIETVLLVSIKSDPASLCCRGGPSKTCLVLKKKFGRRSQLDLDSLAYLLGGTTRPWAHPKPNKLNWAETENATRASGKQLCSCQARNGESSCAVHTEQQTANKNGASTSERMSVLPLKKWMSGQNLILLFIASLFLDTKLLLVLYFYFGLVSYRVIFQASINSGIANACAGLSKTGAGTLWNNNGA
jgi:hypothetical protein